jgi:hypothetical protein
MSFKNFSSCVLRPVSSDERLSSKVTVNGDGSGWKTSSFYLDSSGRASIPLLLQLKCDKATKHDFLTTKCLDRLTMVSQSSGRNLVDPETAAPAEISRFAFGIEAKVTLTFGTGEAITASVENIGIRSVQVQDNNVFFETEIIVSVSRPEGSRVESGDANVKTILEISGVLSNNAVELGRNKASLVAEGLKALGVGGFPELNQTSRGERVQQTRLAPFDLHVTLTNAISISVKSIPSPTMGQTFISLTMSHSNMYSEPVKVTKIALHSSHSQQVEIRMQQTAVKDMSKLVRWVFAPQCDPGLPITLAPNEAFSTVIIVDASEDKRTRMFTCPLSVTAVVGSSDSDKKYSVVAGADVSWTTCRAAIEPADAFRVDMNVKEKECTVGAPLTLCLDIANLSLENRDLMILVDNTTREAGEVSVEKKKAAKTAVVCEVGGAKFGVWGLAGNATSQVQVDPDGGLLTVDVALLMGEVKASSSKTAEIRFIPLREGTLMLPNLKLIDRRRGRWYHAVHNLQLVVQPALNVG